MSGQIFPAVGTAPGPDRRPLIAAVIVFLFAAAAAWGLVRQSEQSRLHEQRAHISDLADNHANAIQSNTQRALSATYALAALVRQGKGSIPNFDETAHEMLAYYPGAASLQLAPGGIIKHVVPLAGNEKAVGHNLLQDPARDKEAFRARDTGQLTLAGPFKLIQGGLGAVGRLPVLLDDNAGQPQFWGFTTVLIRFPEALQNAGLEQLSAQGLGYELWRIHPDSGQKQTIAASAAVTLIDPVTRAVTMPNGNWTLSVAPLKGWSQPLGLALKAILGLLFSLMLGYLTKLLLDLKAHKRHLEALVQRRTAEISAAQAKLQATFNAIPDLVWLKDMQGVYQDCNPMFERFFGAPKTAIVGHTDYDFVTPQQANQFREQDRLAIAADGDHINEEWLTFASDGRHGLFETTKSPVRDASGQLVGVLGIAHDITERRAAVTKIERLSQIYAALSQCNQAIVRCTNETELFAQICHDVVEFGGMKMAWIGTYDRASQAVTPVARYGAGLDYVQGIRISGNGSDPHGRGPTGIAIRERQPVWIQDFQNDLRMAPWHERGAPFGWGSTAALPLQLKGNVVAVFSLYAKETHAFDEAVRRLLLEMADDISYALDGFAREAERQRAVAALRASEERYRALIEWTPEAIIVYGADKILYVNPAAIKLFGASEAQDLLHKSIPDLVHPDFLEEQLAHMKRLTDPSVVVPAVESRFFKLDGTPIDVEVQGTLIVYAGQSAIHVAVRDITERKQAQEKLHLAASVFTHAREGIMITDTQGTIVDVNNAFSEITGYGRDEALGRNPRLLSSGRQNKEYYANMWRTLLEQGHWYGEVWNRRKNGEVYAGMQTISTVLDDRGQPRNYVALFSDITVLKEHQRQLEHIAHYDALTNLPNRVLLAQSLQQGMAQALRHQQLLAVAFLDLDGFKAINDTYGHAAGDQLLIAVASRMKQALREGDSLGRLGGDEFVAVLPGLTEIEASQEIITRLLTAAAQPVQFGEHFLQVSASLGLTFYPQANEIDADQLLRQADQAMYQAKLSGKNRFHLFDAEHDRSLRGHHESLGRIRVAMSAGEFVLHYQPKVNMRTGAVIGVEALIRWQHPEQGLLSPSAFLPVIEDHPLAVELGEWVIATALTQIESWKISGLDIPVSVNIGARQLQQTHFVARLQVLLAAHPQVRAGDLELEVLETSALEELVHVARVIEACREIGVTFALDDFGTGYSSLTYLKRLAVNQLKIDQSFVHDMLDDPDDLAILEGVIGLANAFQRQVIAEGVETIAHGTMLLQFGCELGQGFGIARPMPARELPAWAAAWRPDPAWLNRSLVSRDDLALLIASVEHRAWTIAVTSHLQGERDSPPQLDHSKCRFGQWLQVEGRAHHAARAAFPVVEALHEEVHGLATQLCELRAGGAGPQALARMGEFTALHHALLDNLQSLMLEGRPVV